VPANAWQSTTDLSVRKDDSTVQQRIVLVIDVDLHISPMREFDGLSIKTLDIFDERDLTSAQHSFHPAEQ